MNGTLILVLLALAVLAIAAHGVLVRAGWVRAAAATSLWQLVRGSQDTSGSITLEGARALLMQATPAPDDIAWLEGRLAMERVPRGAAVAAQGLVLAARGDLAGARTLLASVAMLDARVAPPRARRIAREWLIGDAAVRGDWAALASESPLGVGGRAALLVLLGRRLRGTWDAPDDAALERTLRAAYPVGRAPTALTVLCTRARLVPVGAAAARTVSGELPDPAALPPPPHDLVAEATLRHATLLACQGAPPRLVGDAVRRAGRAWDLVLEGDDLEDALAERAGALGAMPGAAASALGRLRAQVVADIAEIAYGGIEVDDARELGDSATAGLAALRDRVLAEVELAADTLNARVAAKRKLSAIDEWREWIVLRAAYEGAVRRVGPAADEVRRLLWPVVSAAGSALACWLWNERGQRALAQAIFAALADGARLVDDERQAEVHRKNADLPPM